MSPFNVSFLLLCWLLFFLPIPAAMAQSTPSLPALAYPSEEVQSPEALPSAGVTARGSPRATMATFLEAASRGQWERAAATLNLPHEGLPEDVISIRGREASAELKGIIDRVAYVDLEAIPEAVVGRSDYVWQVVEGLPIGLEKQDNGEWLFSRQTLRSLPELWALVKDRATVDGVVQVEVTPAMWLRSHVPPALRQRTLVLEHWQWIAIAVLVLVGVLLERVLTFVLVRVMGGQLARRLRQRRVEDALVKTAMRPLGIAGMAGLWWMALLVLGLPAQALAILLLAVKFMAIVAVVWSLYRMVDVGSALLSSYAAETENRYDDLLVPLLRSSAKIFVSVLGVVLLADNLNINITGLLAGLGLGGIAFALAAQDTVKNFFGSVTVLLDRPFQVGDWIVVGEVDGTVESVGFRSTRVRTFYDSLVTLPNANLISAHVDNYGARRYRRWKTTLGVAYDTSPEKLEVLCEGIRELVRRHPYTRKDYFHVYLNEFGASSLDILVYVFWEAPDWPTELRERHRLVVDILRLTHHLGVEIAFPTQTLYLKRGVETVPESGTPGYASGVEQAKRAVRVDVSRLVDEALEGSVPPPAVPD
ncbi:MAG: mechanosensitive ion channel family protein [Steroidobacteraceae bacterium]